MNNASFYLLSTVLFIVLLCEDVYIMFSLRYMGFICFFLNVYMFNYCVCLINNICFQNITDVLCLCHILLVAVFSFHM